MELIQTKLSQGNQGTDGAARNGELSSGLKMESKGTTTAGTLDKLKASNFPASLLRIGCWEVHNSIQCFSHLHYIFPLKVVNDAYLVSV